jgi:hypothetical protein
VERVGGFEEAFHGIYALYEDQAFLAKVYLTARVLVSGERWLRYRQHADSCVSVVTGAGHANTVRRFFLEWLEGYLRTTRRGAMRRVRRAAARALRAMRHPALSRVETRARAVAARARWSTPHSAESSPVHARSRRSRCGWGRASFAG